MRVKNVVLLVLLLFCWLGWGLAQEWRQIGSGYTDFYAVLVNPDNPLFLLAADKNAIIKSVNAGKDWKRVLVFRGANCRVNWLVFWPDDQSKVLAATNNGLYLSRDAGNNWQRIYRGKSLSRNDCLTAQVYGQKIYLGTADGLLISPDQGRSWQSPGGKLAQSRILAIAEDKLEPGRIYIACVDGVFSLKDERWEKIYSAASAEIFNEDFSDNEDDRDQEETASRVGYLITLPGRIILATTSGILESKDRGISWEKMSDYGLLDKKVGFLFVADGEKIFALTKRGLFKYVNQRWEEMTLDLASADLRGFCADKKGSLYIACDKGLFRSGRGDSLRISNQQLVEYAKSEPGIEQVQKAAIKYAEVEPAKIRRWRKQAAGKAVLPKVSASVGRNTSDLWHWETGSSTKAGDDVLIRGNESIDWDITMSWDLSEIIWNNDQTSIDARSRLMVQLRGDILDEVTKLYFERLRVKMELENIPIEDRKKLADKQIRLRELTALLDGLTGGYFSKTAKS